MTVSEIDKQHYVRIRENIKNFIKNLSEQYDSEDLLIMDVAPEIHMGAKEFFKKSTIKTLDIDPESGADYIVDLCETNSDKIKDETFDLILCTEVLEHVNDSWGKIKPNTLFGNKEPLPLFHFCTYRYILTKSGAKKLLNWIEKMGAINPIDHVLGNPSCQVV
jgi:GR25 family glycosyltransferase involved in LPS biosynthesis